MDINLNKFQEMGGKGAGEQAVPEVAEFDRT